LPNINKLIQLYVIVILYLVGLNSSDDISSKECALTSFIMRQEDRLCQTRGTIEGADFELHPLIYSFALATMVLHVGMGQKRRECVLKYVVHTSSDKGQTLNYNAFDFATCRSRRGHGQTRCQ
jgi:hypothetical protein